MAPTPALSTDLAALRTRLSELGARPFTQEVVQSPWQPVSDVPDLHADIKRLMLTVIDGCTKPDAIRCLTVHAPAGSGKTHLLAWLRQTLEARANVMFVSVPPWLADLGGESLERHLLRATVDALRTRSLRQKERFEERVRTFLVARYDDLANDWWKLKRVLRADIGLFGFFRMHSFRIGAATTDRQLWALQRAFDRPGFLNHAFVTFAATHPDPVDGVSLDRDTFTAACLAACGDTRQRWHATSWLHGDPLPAAVYAPFHLEPPPRGLQAIRNALFTLGRLSGQTFCYAFDQLEDTYQVLIKSGGGADRLAGEIAPLVRHQFNVPGICQIFMMQTAVWSVFREQAPPMLVSRMTAEHGARKLPSLTKTDAAALIRARLEEHVWQKLGPDRPPPDRPLFPFTDADVEQLRVQSGNNLREFLALARLRYDELLSATVSPPPPPPRIELTDITPLEVIANEPMPVLIRGRHLPPAVTVTFGGAPARDVTCRPAQGEIDATTPIGPTGEVEVRVCASDDATNSASLRLLFNTEDPGRPYFLHIDRDLMKEARLALDLSQAAVAARVGLSQPKMSQFELGKWRDPPDELFLKLAKIYKKPLSSFRKTSS